MNSDEDSLAAYVDTEMRRMLAEADRIKHPLGFLGMTEPGQELDTDMTRDGEGGSYAKITGNPARLRWDGPAPWEPQPQNDMRPRQVDRAKVKAARKAARAARKRGRK